MKRVLVLALMLVVTGSAFAATATYVPAVFNILSLDAPIAVIGGSTGAWNATLAGFYVRGDGQFKYAMSDLAGNALAVADTADYTIEWTQHCDAATAVTAEYVAAGNDGSKYNYLGPGTVGDLTAAENNKLTLGIEIVAGIPTIKIHNHGFAAFLPPYNQIALDENTAHTVGMRVSYTQSSGKYKYEANVDDAGYQTVFDAAWSTLAAYGIDLFTGGDYVVGRSSRSTALANSYVFGTISVSGSTVPAIAVATSVPSMDTPFFN